MSERVNNIQRSRPRGLFVGLSTIDLTYHIENLPRRNAKVSASSQEIAAGGPATNAALTFAFLGGKSCLVSGVAKNPLSTVIRQELERFSICLYDLARDREEAPPVSSIFVLPGGERTIISANANAFERVDIEPEPAWVDESEIVLVDGHYMSACQTLAASAHRKSIHVVFDGGSWKHGTDALLPTIGTAVCSSDFRPPGCKNEGDVITFLRDHGIRQIAITRGANPVVYVNNDLFGEVPISAAHVIDTTGAGDVFHGAFCYRFCHLNHDFRASLEFAARIATFSCGFPGTRSWMTAFPTN